MIRSKDVIIAVTMLGIVMLFLLQLPPTVMDVMLIINITLSVVILVTALNIRKPLDFSIFPTLLLVTTLFRMSLSISSTRLILANDGAAGNVIQTFGTFVTAGNVVVGLIIFMIIMLAQFIVITKGSERVSEVTARFTLDAMPGKQMAIDADLNSGIIDEQDAKVRRLEIQREADFYGAMDGASKFIKGDAILSILTTFINMIGGVVIGMVQGGMSFGDVMTKYIQATVGDGLVAQVPALLITVSMGIIVTRADSDFSLGVDFFGQLFSKPIVMYVAAGTVVVMSMIPGMPKLLMFLIAGLMVTAGIIIGRESQAALQAEGVGELPDTAQMAADEKRKPESTLDLLQVNPIEMELGYGILPMLDASQGGDLLDRVVMIRRQSALDLGVIVPTIRLRDNIQLGANEYVIKIKGVEVARGEIMPDHFMALNPGHVTETLPGVATVDPTFGLPALWITEKHRERAELLGYTTIDAPSVIATHLTEIIKRYGHELLNRQQVQTLLDNLKQTQPALVEEVVPKIFSLGEVQKVLGNLLRENIPIRDLGTILETLSDYGMVTRDVSLLTEYVRQAMARTISRRFVPENKAHVITLDANLERLIAERLRQTDAGSYVAMEPETTQRVLMGLKAAIERMAGMGMTPLVLTAPNVRRHFKRMVEPMAPDLVVLSYNELETDIEIYADGTVSA